MPVKSTSWTVGDKVFASLKEAQQAELIEVLYGDMGASDAAKSALEQVVIRAADVIRILSVKEKRQRSDRGGKHHRNSRRNTQSTDAGCGMSGIQMGG